MPKQKTLKDKVKIEGIGLHTGEKVKIEILPASPNTGITFVRQDLENSPLIKASPQTVLDPKEFPRRTSIGIDGVHIHTIEHLMAAFCGLEIDNTLVKVWGPEIPGLDGSCRKFIEAIQEVGVIEQSQDREYYLLKEPVYYYEGKVSLTALPSNSFKVSYLLSYDHSFLKDQYVEFELNSENFKDEISIARTFCLEEEVEPLRNMGLGKGADFSNTLVISKEGVIKNSVITEREFAKHKLLDLLGDLYLLGPIKCNIIAIRSGHASNIEFVKRISKQIKKDKRGGVLAQVALKGQISLNIDEIMQILPHRYPFLFVDKILELIPGKKAVGIKNVTINDYFFEGHFPNKPVMPGVLIVEAMAQVGGVLMLSLKENVGKLAYFMAADNVKFRKTVEPGDTLILEAEAKRIKSRTGIVVCRALVEETVVAEAELMFALSS